MDDRLGKAAHRGLIIIIIRGRALGIWLFFSSLILLALIHVLGRFPKWYLIFCDSDDWYFKV